MPKKLFYLPVRAHLESVDTPDIAVRAAEKRLHEYNVELDGYRDLIDKNTAEISILERKLQSKIPLHHLGEVDKSELDSISSVIDRLESEIEEAEQALNEKLPSRAILEKRIEDAEKGQAARVRELLHKDHREQFQLAYDAVLAAYKSVELLQPLHQAVMDERPHHLSLRDDWPEMFAQLGEFFQRNSGYLQNVAKKGRE